MSNKNKELAPDGANIESERDRNSGLSDNTNSNNIVPQYEDYSKGFVSRHLSHGLGNAISGESLVNMLRLKNLRELTQLVERERRDGSPICASTDKRHPGYFLATDADELALYIKALDRRLHNVGLTRKYCAKTLKKMQDEQGR